MPLLHRLLMCVFGLLCGAMTTWAEAETLEEMLKDGHASGALPGLHAVIVHRKGDVLAEVYFEGTDEVWGTPVGNRTHGPAVLHDLRSVTKSTVGILYGIALAKGLVPPPEAKLLESFPEYADLSTPERDAITIHDVLTMRMGSAWDETLPYTDPRNSEIAMEQAPDRIRFILEQPMVHSAGEVFTYSGGATTLLAELIARGSGQPIDVFARDQLFNPLGIRRYEWVRGSDGRPSAASGLRLTAGDLARIGQLVLDDGRVGEQQVVPSDWLRKMLTPHVETAPLRYGYQWWLSPEGAPKWSAALGNGGQRLSIIDKLDMVAVIYAGNYNDPEAWKVPVSVISNYIVPALGLE